MVSALFATPLSLGGCVLPFVAVIDGCPSDQIVDGDNTWHTLAILQAGSWKDLSEFIAEIKAFLSDHRLQLRKWGGDARNKKHKDRNAKFREGFLAAIRAKLPESRVALFTVSCQEKIMVAAEKTLCGELGLEHFLVMGDRPSICIGGYTRHFHKGNEVVTLPPFEKVSLDGRTEVISNPLTVPWKNALIWLWMSHVLWSLYKAVEAKHRQKPAWKVHFDRLANDSVAGNYPGLGFINLLLQATTTVELTSSYDEAGATAADVSTPDLVVDCIAGWVNASVISGKTTRELEESLGEACRSHLGLQVVSDESDIVAMRSNFAS